MTEPFRIVVICTGNSCRSPAAEVILKRRLSEAGLDQNVVVCSAGISASAGTPASHGAAAAVEKLGMSLHDFCSQPTTPELLNQAHLILVMEQVHRAYLEEQYPPCTDSIRLMGNYLFPQGPEEIPDPVGAPQNYFDQVIQIIDFAAQNMIKQWPDIEDRFHKNRKPIIAIGADHRGYQYKEGVKEWLSRQGNPIIDCGTNSEESCDHPDFAFQVSERVSLGMADRGVLICSSGHGMLISANKVIGVRAIIPLNVEHAKMSRSHNNANVITFGADYMDPAAIDEILTAWLDTPYQGGRYQWRINKISNYERSTRL